MILNAPLKIWSLGLFFTVSLGFAQPKLTDWKNLENVLLEDPRPVIVFLHTDWCNYCALMNKKTFRDERVIKKLDQNYYFISFNAEQRESIVFGSKTYRFIPKGFTSGTHELAKVLNDNGVYPTLVVLNKDLEIIYKHQAYIRPDAMLDILNL